MSRGRQPIAFRRPRGVQVVQSGDDRYTLTPPEGGSAALVSGDLLQLWLAVDADRLVTATAVYRGLHDRLRAAYRTADVAAALGDLYACGLLERGDTQRGYDAVADRYDARPPYGEHVYEAILAHSNERHRRRILDVGCGTGGVLARLAPYASEWCGGIEPSRHMLANARRRLRGVANVELHLGNAEQLPFEDASVGLMVVAQALHWFDPLRFWKEAARVLAPEHRVIAFWRLVDLSADNVVARVMWEYGGQAAVHAGYLAHVPRHLPAPFGLLHFERRPDAFVVPDEATAVAMIQSWGMPGETAIEPDQVATAIHRHMREGERWPLTVPCVFVFAVLERHDARDLTRSRSPFPCR